LSFLLVSATRAHRLLHSFPTRRSSDLIYRRARRGYGEGVPRSPERSWRPPSRARVVRVRERLREVNGVPLMEPHGHPLAELILTDRKSTRLNSSHLGISYAVFCLKKKK